MRSAPRPVLIGKDALALRTASAVGLSSECPSAAAQSALSSPLRLRHQMPCQNSCHMCTCSVIEAGPGEASIPCWVALLWNKGSPIHPTSALENACPPPPGSQHAFLAHVRISFSCLDRKATSSRTAWSLAPPASVSSDRIEDAKMFSSFFSQAPQQGKGMA